MLSRRNIVRACSCVACAVGAAGLFKGIKGARSKAVQSSAINPDIVPAARSYAGPRTNGSSLPPLHHIGMVVRDCEKTIANLSGSLGFGPAFTFEGEFPDARLANGETGLSLRGAFVWMHNTALEVVEPVDDRSPHAAFLKERGEGLHHMAYWVASVRNEIDAMAKGGVPPRMLVDGTGPENAVPWCYLEGDMAGGAIIELIERNPGSEQVYAEIFKAIGGKVPA
jgi:hypothetical protein